VPARHWVKEVLSPKENNNIIMASRPRTRTTTTAAHQPKRQDGPERIRPSQWNAGSSGGPYVPVGASRFGPMSVPYTVADLDGPTQTYFAPILCEVPEDPFDTCDDLEVTGNVLEIAADVALPEEWREALSTIGVNIDPSETIGIEELAHQDITLLPIGRLLHGVQRSSHGRLPGTSIPSNRAALPPRIFARSASVSRPICRSIASGECGHEPSGCG